MYPSKDFELIKKLGTIIHHKPVNYQVDEIISLLNELKYSRNEGET